MGIENRDYARGGSPSYSGGGYSGGSGGYSSGGMPPACKWILILTIAVFVVQLIWTAGPSDEQIARHQQQITKFYESQGIEPDTDLVRREVRRYASQRHSVLQRAFELSPDKVFPGFQIWRLVTYAFCHSESSVMHIVFNMLALWFFAPTLERMYGTREFAWFYVVGAAFSGLAFIGLELFLGGLSPVIGASGAVMAVLMLYAVHFPRQVIRIWGILPVEVRWLVGVFVIFDLYPVLKSLGGNVVGDNVAHSAHLGGLAFGYLYFKWQIRFERLLGGFSFKLPENTSKPIRKGNLKLYEPPDPVEMENQVDAILEKISRSGEASLTDQEREILKAASQRYKKRS